jgi:hypothetical protein
MTYRKTESLMKGKNIFKEALLAFAGREYPAD